MKILISFIAVLSLGTLLYSAPAKDPELLNIEKALLAEDIPKVKELLKKGTALPDALGFSKRGLIYDLLLKRAYTSVAFLLHKGLTFPQSGDLNALSIALNYAPVSLIESLIDHGADINYKDSHLGTPLEIALRQKRYDVIKLLMGKGARYKEAYYLKVAVKQKDHKALKLLVEAGTPFDLSIKQLPLLMARKGDLEGLKLLIRAGASVNYKTKKGETLLSQAVLYKQEAVIAWLLAQKLDASKHKQATLHAIDQKDLELVRRLIGKNIGFELQAYKQVPLDTNSSVKPQAKKKEPGVEFEIELDAYYSNISWTFALTDTPVPNAKDKSEMQIYYDLLKNSFPPRFIIFELSVNPMPLLGVYLKDQERDFYKDSTVEGINMVDAITAGFDVPYAASLFIGNTVKFTEPGALKAGGNRAYSGFLLSFSDQHIKENVLVNDKSYEVELKILGSRPLTDYKLKWSYRIGMKLHENRDVTDSVYIGFRRSRLDFESDALSILNNSAIEVKSTFDINGYNPIEHILYFEKKFPVEWWGKKLGLNFGLGYLYQGPDKYRGSLKTEGVDTDRLIIRPNIQF